MPSKFHQMQNMLRKLQWNSITHEGREFWQCPECGRLVSYLEKDLYSGREEELHNKDCPLAALLM